MADTPYIPDTITVHLGRPDDTSADNVTIPFLDYIRNVASSEIYPTWPESAIRANIYAQISFALNRIYTEWYRSKGYDFDITNNTAYDQAFVYGRDIFENISRIVGDIFDNYLARPGAIEPLFSAYCDGRRVTCPGLSQWGTVSLAQEGMTPYEILTRYYGDNLDIRTAPLAPFALSYPGTPLRIGSIGPDVRTIQNRLNRISDNYPLIPKIYPLNSVYDRNTENAVRTFQQTFNLNPDGIVGKATWYEISNIFNAVKRLGELNSEGVTLENIEQEYSRTLGPGSSGEVVRIMQYYLAVIGYYYPNLPVIAIDGFYGEQTRAAVQAYQEAFGLTPDGIIGRDTWQSIQRTYQSILANRPDWLTADIPLLPVQNLVLGSQSESVTRLQQWVNTLATVYPEIGTLPETGYFGEQTRASVLKIEELLGLPEDGVVSPITWTIIAREAQRVRENQGQE